MAVSSAAPRPAPDRSMETDMTTAIPALPACSPVLPSLDDSYAVSSDTIAAFRRDGHVMLPGLANRDEAAAYRPVIAEAIAADVAAQVHDHELSLAERLFPGIGHLWKRHEAVKRFSFARRFAKTVAELLGCKSLRMYHDGSMFKAPGGPGTPWHQDGFYMPVDTDKVVTLWMPLIDVSATMGTLSFASGSHLHRKVQKEPPTDDTAGHFENLIAEHQWPVWSCGDMSAGDACVHSKWTVHRVPPNTSGRLREAFSIIYVDAEARLLDSQDPLARAMIGYNLGGLPGGSLPDEALNPTIYRAG